jgi:YidC/Oxa1 family membrane protein insertase
MLDPLDGVVGWILIHIHDFFSLITDHANSLSWILSIVLLTLLVRLVMFPLVLKGFRTSRAMRNLTPRINELRKQYKGNKDELNKRTMELYQSAGVNPLMGCLPFIVQIPIFVALYTVLRKVANGSVGYGFSVALVSGLRRAHFLGAPLAAHFFNSSTVIRSLGASPVVTRIVIAFAMMVWGFTTFLVVHRSYTWSIRRNMAYLSDSPFRMTTRLSTILMPLFALSGLYLPLGLILYVVTSNVFTLFQQELFRRFFDINTTETEFFW